MLISRIAIVPYVLNQLSLAIDPTWVPCKMEDEIKLFGGQLEDILLLNTVLLSQSMSKSPT